MGKSSFKEAFSYVLFLLSKRDYSLKALIGKVRERFPGISEEELEFLESELLENGYINEVEAARRYFLSKMEKGWGKRKIGYHLRKFGFSEDVIKEVELTTPFDYSFIGREVEKLSSKKSEEQLRRFLLQRGFSFAEISYLLKNVK